MILTCHCGETHGSDANDAEAAGADRPTLARPARRPAPFSIAPATAARALTLLAALTWVSAMRHAAADETPPAPTLPGRVVPYRTHADELLVLVDAAGQQQTIVDAAKWRRRREHILAAFQAVAGLLPPRADDAPLNVHVLESVETELYRRLKLTFAGQEPGNRIPAYLFLPQSLSAGERRPAMLALHQTTPVGKAEPAGLGGDVNLQYGLELAARGYVVLCPDYPSFGEYAFDFAKSTYPSGTLQGLVNHRRAVDLLASRPEVDPERIGVIGHSLGGHNAIFIGAFDERLKVVVSSCGWTPMHDYYGGKLDGWSSDRYLPRVRTEFGLDPDRLPFDLPELIAAVAPRAFFSSSPLHDANFDHAGVRKGIAAVRPVFQLLGAAERLVLEAPDAEHRFPAESRLKAYRFVDEQLGHAPLPFADFVVELPRIAPTEPDEALKSFDTLPGWRMELVAAEPLVASPVALSYDERGRLYVVEMRDYSEQAAERLGRVRLLQDDDGDGRFDRAIVFADDLSWPTAAIAYDGGLFVGAAPDLWFLKDHDGDGVADERRRAFTGFGRGNVQGLLNSFQWGLDNRIYGSSSTAGGDVRRADDPDSPSVSLAGRDFSFDPRSLSLRAETGGGQHGMCFDDWGRRFVSANSDHLQLILIDDRYLRRPGAAFAAPTRQSIATDGPQAEVYRASPIEPWREVRTRLRTSGQAPGLIEGGGRAAGYFTGATGGTIYRGDAWPVEFRGQAFVGDVGSNIVHRKALSEQGVAPIAQRADEQREFVASRDTWFRPVQFANSPHGDLQIIDMYREVIEHPASLPPQIKRFLDLTSGRDRGRIYRLVRDGDSRRPPVRLDLATTAELVAQLEHANGWHRDTAARLLFERRDPAAIAPLRLLAAASPSPLARMHALYSLAGLGALRETDLLPRLTDEHPRVREHAVRLAELFAGSEALADDLFDRSRDDDPRVRYQLALTLADRTEPERYAALATIAAQAHDDPWIIAAVQLAAGGALAELFERTLDATAPPQSRLAFTLERLAEGVAERGSAADINRAAARVARLAAADDAWTEPCLIGLLRGAGRSGQRDRLASALKERPALLERSAELLEQARRQALDPREPIALRRQALELLPAAEFSANQAVAVRLLAADLTDELQAATIRLLGRYDADEAPELIFDAWPKLGAPARSAASFVLFSRGEWVEQAFRAIDTRRVAAIDFDPGALALLGDQAEEMHVRRGDGARAEVVARFQGALSLAGDPAHGRLLFRRNCAGCHRLESFGHEIGPNLSAFANRGAAALLTNILDPNREVGPQFVNQIVVTSDGRAHSGILTSQNAASVTLKRGEELIEILPREEIEEIRSTGQSIMPEGLETPLGAQGLADVIAYIFSAR